MSFHKQFLGWDVLQEGKQDDLKNSKEAVSGCLGTSRVRTAVIDFGYAEKLHAAPDFTVTSFAVAA